MPFNWFLLIPILGIICGMLMIYMNHRRKMAMIEMNIKPEEPYKQWHLLISGLSITAIGLALRLNFQPIPRTPLEDVAAISGSVLFFLGIGLIVGYLLILIISLSLKTQQTTERRHVMKALLNQLKSFKNEGATIEIKTMDGSNPRGTIKDILNDEVLILEVAGQPHPTFISIDKITYVRRV